MNQRWYQQSATRPKNPEGIVFQPLVTAQIFGFPVLLINPVCRLAFALRRLFKIRTPLAGFSFGPFEDRVGVEYFLDVFSEFDPVQLQQSYCLLQLGRQRQFLRKPELE